MKTVIIGRGEIGSAYKEILSKIYDVTTYDLKDGPDLPNVIDVGVIHLALPSPRTETQEDIDTWIGWCKNYVQFYKPKYVSVLSTVPPGTTERIRWDACHSTSRCMHPDCAEFILGIPKHIGGPKADKLCKYFERAGIECVPEARARDTELAHILCNIEYGLLCAFTDEKWRICRKYGVDPLRAVHAYTQTYNLGYTRMGHASKVRPLLTPPGGHLGGHCVCQNAEMMYPILKRAGVDSPLLNHIANFNREIE